MKWFTLNMAIYYLSVEKCTTKYIIGAPRTPLLFGIGSISSQECYKSMFNDLYYRRIDYKRMSR